MSNANNDETQIEYLEFKIKEAQENNEPIDQYVLREIKWLKQQLDLYLDNMKQKGVDIDSDYDIAQAEILQYAAMKDLAKRINHPTEEYDTHIKEVQCRIFGEENWENFFGSQSE